MKEDLLAVPWSDLKINICDQGVFALLKQSLSTLTMLTICCDKTWRLFTSSFAPDNPLIWKGLSLKTVSGIVHLPVVPLVCVHDLTCMVLHLHCVFLHTQDSLAPASSQPKYSFAPSTTINKMARPFSAAPGSASKGPVIKPVSYAPKLNFNSPQPHNG